MFWLVYGYIGMGVLTMIGILIWTYWGWQRWSLFDIVCCILLLPIWPIILWWLYDDHRKELKRNERKRLSKKDHGTQRSRKG